MESFKSRLRPDYSSQNPEDHKWFSKQRAKRGAKIGATASGTLVSGLTMYSLMKEGFGEMGSADVIKNTTDGVIVIFGTTLTGALVDGFKTSSALLSTHLIEGKELIQNFKAIRSSK